MHTGTREGVAVFSTCPANHFPPVSRYSSDVSENRVAAMNSRTSNICVEGLILVDPYKPRLPADRGYPRRFSQHVVFIRIGPKNLASKDASPRIISNCRVRRLYEIGRKEREKDRSTRSEVE